MNGKPFEVDKVITEEGLAVLRKKLPEIPPENIHKGITMNDICMLITVEIFVNMVYDKIIEMGKRLD